MSISLHVGTSAAGRSLLHYGGTLGAALPANRFISRESCLNSPNSYITRHAKPLHVWWDPKLQQQIERAGKNRLLAFHVCDWLTPTTDLLNDRGMMGDAARLGRGAGHLHRQAPQRGLNPGGRAGFVHMAGCIFRPRDNVSPCDAATFCSLFPHWVRRAHSHNPLSSLSP